MKGLLAVVAGIVSAIVLLLLLDFVFFKWFYFIEPKKEDMRREIFINTRSYVEGKTQDLIKYMFEYQKASEDEKIVLESVIRHSFAEFDENKLDSEELKSFLKKIKYGGVK